MQKINTLYYDAKYAKNIQNLCKKYAKNMQFM